MSSFGWSVLAGASFYGLWRARRWAWALSVTTLVAITLASVPMYLLMVKQVYLIPTLLHPAFVAHVTVIALNIVCLWYLARTRARAMFEVRCQR